MSRRWFGTDGIRGRAGVEPLVPDFLARLGRALGEQSDGGEVLLGRDTRESGPAIAGDLARGLRAGGARVTDLGVLPTAAVPMAMRVRGAAFGVMVSASHNPWADNGVKVFAAGGLKLGDAQEIALEERIEALPAVPADAPDAVHVEDGAAAYEAVLRVRFAHVDLSGLTLAVDCAHGSAHLTAPDVLRSRGATLTVIGAEPDGRNINEGCGSTDLRALTEIVSAGGHDLGLAFDGDADRVLMVDSRGRPCTGDHMLAFLGRALDARGELPGRTVVATTMSNLGLEQTLTAAGISLHRTQVGDRYVLEAMQQGGFALGGEASGHLLFATAGAYLGDGLYTALQLLGALVETGTDLASVVDSVPSVPQVLLNVPVAGKPPVETLERLQQAVSAAEADHGADIRIVLRYSGTENLARVMVEGTDAGVVDALSSDLARLWEEEIAAVGR